MGLLSRGLSPNAQASLLTLIRPQVWQNRTALVRSICEYAESKPVRSLLRALMSRANNLTPPPSAPTTTAPSMSSAPGRISRGLPLPPTTPKPVEIDPSPPPRSNVISVVLPDQQTIFGNYPALTTCNLTGSEYRSVDQKYRYHTQPLLLSSLSLSRLPSSPYLDFFVK
jgi:hypothetical protein